MDTEEEGIGRHPRKAERSRVENDVFIAPLISDRSLAHLTGLVLFRCTLMYPSGDRCNEMTFASWPSKESLRPHASSIIIIFFCRPFRVTPFC
jgi:hypothetical protein